MSLLTPLLTPHADVVFWEITESEEQMLSQLPSSYHYALQLAMMKAPRRRREWLATRCLLHQWLGENVRIHYRIDGSPQLLLADGELRECSITHTEGIAAIALSKCEKPVGLDMESHFLRAYRLRHRYLSLHEQEELLHNEDDAVMLWCAKEAVFKLCHTPGLGFLDHILLHQEGELLWATLPTLNKRAQIHTFIAHHYPMALATFV